MFSIIFAPIFTNKLTLKEKAKMKKVFLMAVAAVAITFASCGNKTQNGGNADSAAVDSAAVVDASSAAEESIGKISALFGGNDANKMKEAVDAVKAKASELLAKNPEVAKEYLTKVQTFMKENAEKIKSVVGDNAVVGAAVSALTDTPAEKVISGLSSALGSAKEAGAEAIEGAEDAANQAADAVKGAPEAAKAAAEKTVEDAKAKVDEKVNDAKAKANEKVNNAVNDAKSKAAAGVDKAASDAKKALGL